ncbi:unnamed protein product [Malassezia sympodialis ATCC 42132]|uniref:Succinate dehydrogenase assembly factor 4, mitochondrial n=1 Tax=Malassezia sympodialis (strain ATCC 42132) TaxID=1230383 RepID=M5EQ37_MALS4|nr:uncharacterized protein MSY001_2571 [Malassezia sympodialis ATCC 42132]CCU99865.1 unnamed protein product [Malassezia sympodialis ATCC 42132]SHO76616.1 Similar to S.cerevisiae protein SDH8 (Protein required for assembly of succinate dehydrogenase) [Malassezia sympodialis ATCC 42132]|eukprot:XP_018741093.1 uncharacterized protein MSY001_2571 [Malassezia sympodialis ATCC 42132]
MLRTFSSNVAERAPCQLRTFASSVLARSDAPFSRPGPIPLPKEEQKEFEKLVRDKENTIPFADIDKEGKESNAHPDARQKASVEFEGDVNPVTGEVGGPKTDPLRWNSEWTFGGRATDF